MADYGFRARNGVNEVQIDSSYRSFALRQRGIAYANANSIHVNFKFATVVIPYSLGMIAFRCARPCTLASITPSGGNMVANFLVYTQGGVGEPVYWYLFDEPNYGQMFSGNYAMRIKNAAGQITHDSRMDYLKFAGFNSGTLASLPTTSSGLNPNYAFFVYPGTLPAVIQGVTCSSQEEVPVGISNPEYMQFYFWQMFCQTGTSIGTTLCVQDFGPSNMPSNLLSIRRENFSITVIDVARYA
ncbi:hypothetical protein [Achromobacter phage ewik_TL4]|nr:hypothetical protein [Achromobacter phage hasilly_LB3]WNO48734.1 hypothetical protein [Achromobacter phage nyaak_TL1]WNO48928.1 hypothetical protein [Achromobacter phage ewii_LB8]WNO49199.1 hypothetical protein [Achromobacter phage ewik_TL4]WOZ53338.1 hypothetical protein [Achromobacter phage tuull]